MKNNAENKELGDLEQEIMNILWDNGKMTAKQVKEILDSKKELALTTILTVLSRLKEKKYVKEVPSLERSIMFQAAIQREKVAGKSIRKMLSNFFKGSPKAMMLHLLKEEKIDDEEIEEIRKMLEAKSDSAKSGNEKKGVKK